jgi:diguanylate cyclase (GGDEF)-like protein
MRYTFRLIFCGFALINTKFLRAGNAPGSLIKNAFTLFFLALFIVSGASAIEDAADSDYPRKISFRDIMQNQDIALGEVEGITEDHEGFMWLGGRNALLRYDGYEFLNVLVANNPADISQTSPVTQVLELLEDSRNILWAATRSGLYQYHRDRELLLPVQDSEGKLLFRETIYALEESPDGDLLIGTGSGLYIFNPVTLTTTLLNDAEGGSQIIPSNYVGELLVDRADNLWLGLSDGLIRLNWRDKTSTLFVPDEASHDSAGATGILTLAEDPEGNIWAGNINGLYRLDPATGAIKRYQHNPQDPYSLPNNLVRQIVVDKRGWMWVGSDSGGISLYDRPNDRFLRFARQDGLAGSLSSDTVRRIYEDSIGDLWVGTYPSGVNVYDRSTAAIRVYRKEAEAGLGLLDNNVEAVEIDSAGVLWTGGGGITRYDPVAETFTHYQHTGGPDSRSDSTSVINGLVDSHGDIRFGSWGHGIQLYDTEKDRFAEIPTDITQVKRGKKTGTLLNDKMVWSITEDKRQNLWIATHSNGLTKYDRATGVYTFYPFTEGDPTGISSIVVWTTFEDSRGNFWIGTAHGLNLMDRDKGTFSRYMPNTSNPRGLQNGSVLSIWEDKKGRLWFGTDGGLHLYDYNTDDFTVYNLKDGFADQGIRVILEDQSGSLWLGTNNGIIMFNPDTKLVRNYVRYNGEIIGGVATGAGVVTPAGEIVFGTRSGLYIFDATKLVTNEKPPSVVMTDFRVFTEKVPVDGPDKILTKVINQTDSITLDHSKSMISFSFAALNFRDADKNQYAYKLEGFDDEWREVGNQRTALYTNLPTGTYKFRVKASNNDGVWNETGKAVTLKILPPPWKSWWAYAIYTALAALLLMLLLRRQHRRVLTERRINQKLEQKVAERTAELQHAYAQLEAISLSDPLTGLSNRRYLQQAMPKDIAKIQREYSKTPISKLPANASLDFTFFILDVDNFKSVNDVHGHAAGDRLLIEFSELLTKTSRESDCIVRWGGEEFLVISRFTKRDEAPEMAERIRRSIEQHTFELADGTLLKKTCSIGFACFPFLHDQPMAVSWEQVIDIADRALYAAKKSGRNRSVGIFANASTDETMLYHRICDDMKQLIDFGQLTVIAANKEDLQWD